MNFVQLPKIWKHLTGNELKLFTVLYDEWTLMKNEDGWFYRSQKQLCEDCNFTKNTLKNTLDKLSEEGIIMTTSYNNGVDIASYNKANEYKINMDRVIELSEKGSKIDTFNMKSDKKGVKISPKKGSKIDTEGVKISPKKGSKIDTEGVKISPPSNNIIINTKETNTKVNVTYESLQDETTENKLKEKNKKENESFQTETVETNEEDFNKISNEEVESSSDDTLDNNKINSNLEEDMNMMTIPQGQIDALHSYVDNHISSSTTPEEYAEVEKNLNNYFNRLYNQYNDTVVAQLESDVRGHLKNNMTTSNEV